MDIKITRTASPKAKPADESALGFARTFTDHMFAMDYTVGKGWFDPRIIPYGPLSLAPSSCVLHYAAEIFEGLKAYRRADGGIQLFRPMDNVRRLNSSAERMCLPQIPEEDVMQAIETIVEMEQDWTPYSEGTSLYIRPFLIGTDDNLGVHTCKNISFYIILAPSGSYYEEGVNPVKIMIETRDVRTVRGGTGYAKCGGNYAASTRAGHAAELMGYAQVLWLDAIERKYIEEVGSMNVMFKIDGKIITPMLTDSILPGITRSSCITLLRDWGYEVEERLLSVDELFEACKAGKLDEAWGTGTAAVISPMGELLCNGERFVVNGGKTGPVSQRLYDELTGIQWGRRPDPHGWIYPIRKNT